MANSMGKIAIAGVAALTLAFGPVGSANAAWGSHGGSGGGHWGGHGWGWGGVGAGIVGGLALGAALSAPYWGGYGYYGGYGPYAYGPDYGYAYQPYAAYAYAPNCHIRGRVVFDRFGHEHIRRVRVCH